MKKNLYLFLFILLINSFLNAQDKLQATVNQKVDKIVKELVTAYQKLESAKYRNNLAVMQFEEMSKEAREKKIGFGASELIETRLSQTKLFNIIERDKIEVVIDEIALGMTGLVDDASAAKAGKLLGADIVVLGSVSELGDFFNLNVRMVEVETGKILTSATSEIKKESFLERIHYVKPKSYRIGFGYSMQFNNNQVTHYDKEFKDYAVNIKKDKDQSMNPFITIDFSYDLSDNIFWDIELGAGLTKTYAVSGDHPGPVSIVKIAEGLLLNARINHWIWDYQTIGVALFGGGGVITRTLEYSHFLNYNIIYQEDLDTRQELFYTGQLGASLYLYQISMVSVRFDLGYQFSSKNIWEFPFEINQKPKSVIIDPSGLIFNTKVRLYF